MSKRAAADEPPAADEHTAKRPKREQRITQLCSKIEHLLTISAGTPQQKERRTEAAKCEMEVIRARTYEIDLRTQPLSKDVREFLLLQLQESNTQLRQEMERQELEVLQLQERHDKVAAEYAALLELRRIRGGNTRADLKGD
jgi:hypothetical protein